MRCHVDKHILAGKITGPTVCGYCVLTSCTIGLTSYSIKGGVTHYKTTSNCYYFEKFNLKSAETITKSMSCTNKDNEYDDSFSATEKEISVVKLQKC